MQTISFYSYKGGTGRSLMVANIARYLEQFGQSVVAIDFDLEAPGLHYKFSNRDSRTPLNVDRGLVDWILDYLEKGSPPEELRHYLCDVPPAEENDGEGRVVLMPAGAAPSWSYWHKLSSIDWHELFYGDENVGVPLFLQLKEQIKSELNPDMLLVDSRTGITEMSGVATTILPDRLVCLLLRNAENLEGAREVLRSLTRRERAWLDEGTPEIIPVVARLPAAQSPDHDEVVVNDVRDFLNEPAGDLHSTLESEMPLVLHSDPLIQMGERILIGSSVRSETSVLLRDYLRLFSRLIPREVIEPRIDEFVAIAKANAFEDPEASQANLESLAELGHPRAFEALLKFYRLRNVSPEKILDTARQLWEIAPEWNGSLLWSIVRESVTESLIGAVPHRGDALGLKRLATFVEAIWRRQGALDVAVGRNLASLHMNSGDYEHAAEVLLSIVNEEEADASVARRCVGVLGRVGRTEQAREVILATIDRFGGEAGWLGSVAEFAWENGDTEVARTLLEREGSMETLRLDQPELAARLMLMLGHRDEADELATQALQSSYFLRWRTSRGRIAIRQRLPVVARLFGELGRYEEFVEEVRSQMGDEAVEEIERLGVSGPPSWEQRRLLR